MELDVKYRFSFLSIRQHPAVDTPDIGVQITLRPNDYPDCVTVCSWWCGKYGSNLIVAVDQVEQLIYDHGGKYEPLRQNTAAFA